MNDVQHQVVISMHAHQQKRQRHRQWRLEWRLDGDLLEEASNELKDAMLPGDLALADSPIFTRVQARRIIDEATLSVAQASKGVHQQKIAGPDAEQKVQNSKDTISTQLEQAHGSSSAMRRTHSCSSARVSSLRKDPGFGKGPSRTSKKLKR